MMPLGMEEESTRFMLLLGDCVLGWVYVIVRNFFVKIFNDDGYVCV